MKPEQFNRLMSELWFMTTVIAISASPDSRGFLLTLLCLALAFHWFSKPGDTDLDEDKDSE